VEVRPERAASELIRDNLSRGSTDGIDKIIVKSLTGWRLAGSVGGTTRAAGSGVDWRWAATRRGRNGTDQGACQRNCHPLDAGGGHLERWRGRGAGRRATGRNFPRFFFPLFRQAHNKKTTDLG